MAKENVNLLAFNRGLISPLALARIDLERMKWSAETQNNWMPRTLGSMMLRPGMGYIGAGRSNLKAKHIPFIYAATDTAILEQTNQKMRVRGQTEQLVTRPAVSTAVTNGTFLTDLTGWTDADQAGATSSWITGGYMGLLGTTFNAAIRRQTLTVSAPDQNVEHAFNIVINRGRVTLRVGSTSGTDNLIRETVLAVGSHSLAFTPTGASVFVELSSRTRYTSLVDSINIAATGVMEVDTPWLEADLPFLRWDQSADVVFVDCYGYQQRRIERRATDSWSVVLYQPEDGPFRIINTTSTRITPSGINGDITLTASQPLFKATQVGTLFRMTSTGQRIEASISGEDQWSDPIRITGIGTTGQRLWFYAITGIYTATLTLQRSVGDIGAWVDIQPVTGSGSINDGLDNQIIYYRIGIKTGNYTSGTADIVMTYANGGLTGVVRVTAFTSETSVSAIVLKSLGGTGASEDWSEGQWSDYRGWPSATALHQGRLGHFGKGFENLSISDAYESFDDTTEGDAGPISRGIGQGPVDNVFWALSLRRLLAGTASSVVVAQSSSLDEPLTPTNFNLTVPVTKGSANIPPAKIDGNAIMVNSTYTRLVEISLDNNTFDYGQNDLTRLCPEVGSDSKFSGVAVQREPDTRVLSPRADGSLAVLLYDPVEDVRAMITMDTDGVIEDTFTMPPYTDMDEDRVYHYVRRTANSVTVRYLERMAAEKDCKGGTLSKLADSFLTYTGAATNVLPAAHLIGRQVVVWADGKDYSPDDVDGVQKTYLVDGSGNITLDPGVTVSSAVYGLGYDAQFKSTKLAYGARGGSALTQKKRVNYLGLILANTHAKGLKYGRNFTDLQQMPDMEDGVAVSADKVWESYDKDAVQFDGDFDTDARICLVAKAPRCVTVLACVMGLETHEKG